MSNMSNLRRVRETAETSYSDNISDVCYKMTNNAVDSVSAVCSWEYVLATQLPEWILAIYSPANHRYVETLHYVSLDAVLCFMLWQHCADDVVWFMP